MIRNIFSSWASVGLNMGVAFLLTPFLVHSLGASDYGLWVLVLSVTGYMGLLDSGLRVSIVKHTAQCNARGDADGLNRVLFTGLSLFVSLGVLVVLLSLVAAAFFDSLFTVPASDVATGRVLVFIAGLNVASSLPLGVLGGLLAGLQRYDLLNRSSIIVLLIRTAAVVAAIQGGFGLITLGWIHVATQVVSGVIMWRLARGQFPQLNLKPRRLDRATVQSLYSYSGYIVLNNVAMFLLFYSGEVLIGAFIGTVAVTSYAIARSLVQYLSTIIGSMTQVFHPYASDQHERKNSASVGDAVLIGTKVSLLIALPIGVAYLIVGPTFISLWMGPEFGQSAGLILAVLTVPQIVWLSQSAAGNILLGIGRHKLLTATNLATGVVGIALALALVSRFGSVGVAVGLGLPILVSQTLLLPVWTARAVNLRLGAYFTEAYAGPLMAVLPFALSLFIVFRLWPPSHLVAFALQGILCLVTFIPSVYFLAFSRSERQYWIGKLRPAGPVVKGAS